VISANEVPARPPEHGDPERAHRGQHILSKAAAVAERRAFLEDPAVDAAAEVLDEVAEDPPVDGSDATTEIDGDASHARESR